jgi:glycosyltransferase involved in cell wall biosynthesis
MGKVIVELSVVIPLYNAGCKLHDCLRSVLAQTERSMEVIVVNDGSTDDSRTICGQYASMDDRIVVIDQPRSGSIAARRRGVEAATAPYVSFVDADDLLDPAMLERLLQAIRLHHADIAVCNSYRIFNGMAWPRRLNASRFFLNESVYRGASIRDELVTSFLHGHAFPASLHGKLYRTGLVRSCGAYLDQLSFFGDDLYYNMELFLHADTVALIPESLYYYRAGGMTSRYMPELLQDILAGYRVQRRVIDHYYPSGDRDKHYIGSNLMLLNVLPACLRNLYLGGLTQVERHAQIAAMCHQSEVESCARHEPSARHANQRIVQAIVGGDIAYLDRAGHIYYMKQRLKHWILYPLYAIDTKKFDKLRNNFLKSGDRKRQHLRSR